jgi:uncharacterized membrane protein YagU involved in acid resistance
MRSKTGAGIVAGLMAGIVMGMMMQMMPVTTPDGMRMPMMAMVAKVVRSDSLAVGWIYHLLNSAAIGAIFGWLLGNRATAYGAGLGWGAVYGLVWWVVGGLILMPVFLGMSAFSPLKMMLPVAMGSMVGHLMYGVILGLLFVWLRRKATVPAARPA